MVERNRSRTRIFARGRGGSPRRAGRAALALWLLTALVASLGAAPVTAAADPVAGAAVSARGLNLSELTSGVHTLDGREVTVTRSEMRRPTGVVRDASMDTAEAALLTHGFETWPGPWSVWSETADGWGLTTTRATEGARSAYCAGARVAAPGPYPGNMNTWLTVGPFDLRNYDLCTLLVDLGFVTEKDQDYIAVGISTDDDRYQTIALSGDSEGWWLDTWVDLHDFYGDGTVDLTGNPRVWIAFIFQSNASVAYEGAYLDKVRLTADLRTIEPPVPVTEIAGDDRYITAVDTSEIAYPEGAETVIIATGRNWPDALGGSALAGVLDAPILLTDTGELHLAALNEIRRLGASRAVILGGEAAVGPAVEATLKRELGAEAGIVDRIGGSSRYETANLVARRVVQELDDAYDGTAFIATGANFPDALAAAPIAAAKGWPIYLANPDTGLAPSTATAMGQVTAAHLLGGEMAVPSVVQWDLIDRGVLVTRFAGPTRYSTAAVIARHAVDQWGLSWDGTGIATGENYPDALAGGVLQAKTGSVMLLTLGSQISYETTDVLRQNRASITKITIFGGPAAIRQVVRNKIYLALGG